MITNLNITPMIAPTDAKIPHMRDTIVSISIDVLSIRDVVKNIGDTNQCIPNSDYKWSTA